MLLKIITQNIKPEETNTKNCHLKNTFFMTIRYLRDMTNDHKTPMKLKAPSGETIDDDSFG